ncbi:MAG TPA: hypothetical protein DF984_07485 [Anaerolineaceae bacterium]|nr:hypothetical protein [Anaerolineaceae bacterium]
MIALIPIKTGPFRHGKMKFNPALGVEMLEEFQPKTEPIFDRDEEAHLRQPRNLKEKFVNFYYNAVPYFTLNLVWCALSLPVVTIFPALGGLYYAVLQMSQDGSADGGTVWEGFKKFGWLSLRWGVLVYGLGAVLVLNIWFYFNLDQAWAIFALSGAVVFLLIWIAINQFSFPILLLQEEKKIILAIRNGFIIVMRKPLVALKVIALSLLISAVSILLPPLWIFISMAWIINIRTRTAIKVIKTLQTPDEPKDTV